MDRSRTVSVVVGLAAAVVVGLIGPIYAALILICATPLIFLTLSRAVTGRTIDPAWPWLLIAFGVAWFVLLPVAPIVQGATSSVPDGPWAVWAVIGGFSLIGLGAIVASGFVVTRRRPT
jgi:hypothetical protein